MFAKKCIGAALVCALALGAWSGTALANQVTVGGVVFDPDSPLDLNIQALNFRETGVTSVGDVLQGYGRIGSINGTNDPTFCPGCDLVFTFSYTVSSNSGGSNPSIVFNNGGIQFYVAADGSFDVNDPSTASGTPWLTLSGHTFQSSNTADFGMLTGQLFASINGTAGNPQSGSTGFGLLDATGGIAMPYVNTNTIAAGNGWGFADFSLNSSFLVQDAGICDASGTCYPVSGTGILIGDSAVGVPEPGEAGLLGLGLGVLGLFMWWRRKETEERQE